MAKARIRRLKSDRFWRWMQAEAFGHKDAIAYYAAHPIAQRKFRMRKRRTWWRKLARHREQATKEQP